MIQWDAPRRVLGGGPGPANVDRDQIYAVSDGDVAQWCDFLEERLLELNNQMELSEITNDSDTQEITFYLEEPDWPEWTPIARVGPNWYLTLGAGMGLVVLEN